MFSLKCLLIEDEKLIRQYIVEYFSQRNEIVIEASNGYDGLEKLRNEHFDLVLLDIMMPGIDGYEVCSQIKQDYDIPIIFISALSEEDNKLKGYELGCDDYVSKPFTPSILHAKCKAILRRYQKNNHSILKCKGIELDEQACSVYIDNVKINVTIKEFELLKYLMTNKDIVLTREVLLNKIWGYDFYGDERVVDTYIKMLRKKLKHYASYIHTVYKMGYVFKEGE